MTHATDDELLLHAFGELPDDERRALDVHLASCAGCRERFASLEESRVALAWGSDLPSRASHGRRLAWLALPLAAGIGGLMLLKTVSTSPQRPAWQPHLVGSPTAGYVTATSIIAIDSQLTKLERGNQYGPN
jgi:hypothetical protein